MTFFFVLSENTSAEDTIGRAQVGLTVGRALGGAVDRNRIKRRIRDVVRHQLGALNTILVQRNISAAIVINPKKSALTTDVADLRTEIERAFNVIGSAKPGVSTASPPRKIRTPGSKAARRESKH